MEVGNGHQEVEWQGPLRTDGVTPAARYGQSLSRFPLSGVIVLFGGQSASGSYLNDMFTLCTQRSSWTRVSFAPKSPVPCPRSGHTLTVVSSSTLVLFGGVTQGASGPTMLNDLWTLDLRSRVWQQVHGTTTTLPSDMNSVPNVPTPRALHTAVFNDGTGYSSLLPPGIFVFGGSCGQAKNTVFRLRVDLWQWDALSNVGCGEAGIPSAPSARERHAAVWLPGQAGGMAVVGGTSAGIAMADVWLFELVPLASKRWRWRKLAMKPLSQSSTNRLGPCTDHSLIQSQGDPFSVIVWGGRRGPGPGQARSPCILLDLKKSVSLSCSVTGTDVPNSRIMHSVVAFSTGAEQRVLLYGGYRASSDDATLGDLTKSVMWALWRSCSQVSGAATAFNTEGSRIDSTAKQIVPVPLGAPVSAPNGTSATSPRVSPLPPTPLENPGSSYCAVELPRGTPLTGRILDVTEVGHFVSVIIGDQECKGVLVVNPNTVRRVPARGGVVDQSSVPGRRKPTGAAGDGGIRTRGIASSGTGMARVSHPPASDDIVVVAVGESNGITSSSPAFGSGAPGAMASAVGVGAAGAGRDGHHSNARAVPTRGMATSGRKASGGVGAGVRFSGSTNAVSQEKGRRDSTGQSRSTGGGVLRDVVATSSGNAFRDSGSPRGAFHGDFSQTKSPVLNGQSSHVRHHPSGSSKTADPSRPVSQRGAQFLPGNVVSAAISAQNGFSVGDGHPRASSVPAVATDAPASATLAHAGSANVLVRNVEGSSERGSTTASKRPAGTVGTSVVREEASSKRQRVMDDGLTRRHGESLGVEFRAEPMEVSGTASMPETRQDVPPVTPTPTPFLPNVRGEQDGPAEVIDLG